MRSVWFCYIFDNTFDLLFVEKGGMKALRARQTASDERPLVRAFAITRSHRDEDRKCGIRLQRRDGYDTYPAKYRNRDE